MLCSSRLVRRQTDNSNGCDNFLIPLAHFRRSPVDSREYSNERTNSCPGWARRGGNKEVERGRGERIARALCHDGSSGIGWMGTGLVGRAGFGPDKERDS